MDADLTRDEFLGGALSLWQPRHGYRAGIDPVLLAASVPAKSGERLLDLGCGVGTAALCVRARVPGIIAQGVERDPLYARLAARNGLDCVKADLTDLPDPVRLASFDHIIANPPYFDRSASHPSGQMQREAALGEDTPLSVWIDVAARRLAPKGYFHIIHKASSLPRIVEHLSGRLGSIEVKPIAARADRMADRIIVRARKEGRAAFRLHAPLIVHARPVHERDGEDYAPTLVAVLRRGAALNW